MTPAVHPLTQERLNKNAEAWRAIDEYADASHLCGQREVNTAYVVRKRGEAKSAVDRLVEAAGAESAEETITPRWDEFRDVKGAVAEAVFMAIKAIDWEAAVEVHPLDRRTVTIHTRTDDGPSRMFKVQFSEVM